MQKYIIHFKFYFVLSILLHICFDIKIVSNDFIAKIMSEKFSMFCFYSISKDTFAMCY